MDQRLDFWQRSRPLLALVLSFALLAAACGDSDDEPESQVPPPAADDEASTEPDDPDEIEATETATAWRVEELVDPSRPTDEQRDGEGTVTLAAADERRIPVGMLYVGADDGGEDAPPADVEARPVVVWLNGLGGLATPEDPFLRGLADAGYLIVFPNQPEISAPVSSAAGYPKLPGDVAFLVDALADPADGFADDLVGQLDLDRLAVAGHSIGTSTVLATTGHACCRDERFLAGVAVGGSDAFGFDGAEYELAAVPLLLVHGTEDQVFAFAEAERIAGAANDNVSLYPHVGADHFDLLYGDDDVVGETVDIVKSFLDVHVAGTADASSLPEELRAA